MGTDHSARIAAQAKKIGEKINASTKEEAEESFILETEMYNAEVTKLNLKNQRRRDNNELRKAYAEKAYGLATYSVFVWSLLFIAVAIGNAASGREILSTNALATLTAGATLNVLAAFLAIVRGLFPQKSAKPKRK